MDKRRKRVLAVLGVGSLILCWRLYAVVTKYLPSSAQAEPAPVGAVMPVASMGVPGNSTRKDVLLDGRLALQQRIDNKDWGRNPFKGIEPGPVTNTNEDVEAEPSEEKPPAPTVSIVGVSASGGVWLAAINGNVYRVGDDIADGLVVQSITQRAVALESQGWVFKYSLGVEEPIIARIDGSHE